MNHEPTKQNLFKAIGPGLLFASTAIGTSHLVLSTRAGAHHGMGFLWIIIIALLLKYPFYEFGPRYANATGYSLLKGYKDQGKWAVYLFLAVIIIDMFSVVAAIGAVCAGILSTMFGISFIPVSILSGLIIGITMLMLILGGYSSLDNIIKLISIVLLVTVVTAFVAVLLKGPVPKASDFQASSLVEGAGLSLLIGLIGWMPAGMEASTMSSIWNIEKANSTNYQPSLKESLFDFNLGYWFSTLLALMFLTIGAFTVYGTGQLLDGNATQFSNKLLAIFTGHLGQWSYYIIAIASFVTIYGTLIAVMDAFPRCFVRGLRVLRFHQIEHNDVQNQFLQQSYQFWVVILSIGGFGLFYYSAASMITLLDIVTIISFLLAPIIAFLNLRAIQSDAVPASHRPSSMMIGLAYLGLLAMIGFSVYYLISILG